MSATVDLSFVLNGQPARARVAANASLLSMLRETFDLAGAKLACGEGECGACTVIVDGVSVNSCLMPAVECAGREVLTVEGLGGDGGLDPVQRAFVELGAVQCGYCIPGMVMQATYLLSRHPRPSEEAVRRGLEGNICRCTGYRKIVAAVMAAARAGMGETP